LVPLQLDRSAVRREIEGATRNSFWVEKIVTDLTVAMAINKSGVPKAERGKRRKKNVLVFQRSGVSEEEIGLGSFESAGEGGMSLTSLVPQLPSKEHRIARRTQDDRNE